MKSNIYKEVLTILGKNEASRSYDAILKQEWHKLHPEVNVYYIPTGTLERARRYWQSELPHLQGTDNARRVRKEREVQHRDFFSRITGLFSKS